jgi:hypothetical protein
MENVIIIISLLAVIIFGYFVMKRLDAYLDTINMPLDTPKESKPLF